MSAEKATWKAIAADREKDRKSLPVKTGQIWEYQKKLYKTLALIHPTGREKDWNVGYAPIEESLDTNDFLYYTISKTGFSRKLDSFLERFKKRDDWLLEKTFALAAQVHQEQADKSIENFTRVANQTNTCEEKIVAILQDVINNSSINLHTVAEMYPSHILISLSFLISHKSVAHKKYIQRIAQSGNSLAIAVKIADLKDDIKYLSSARSKAIAEENLVRKTEYLKSLELLLIVQKKAELS